MAPLRGSPQMPPVHTASAATFPTVETAAFAIGETAGDLGTFGDAFVTVRYTTLSSAALASSVLKKIWEFQKEDLPWGLGLKYQISAKEHYE